MADDDYCPRKRAPDYTTLRGSLNPVLRDLADDTECRLSTLCDDVLCYLIEPMVRHVSRGVVPAELFVAEKVRAVGMQNVDAALTVFSVHFGPRGEMVVICTGRDVPLQCRVYESEESPEPRSAFVIKPPMDCVVVTSDGRIAVQRLDTNFDFFTLSGDPLNGVQLPHCDQAFERNTFANCVPDDRGGLVVLRLDGRTIYAISRDYAVTSLMRLETPAVRLVSARNDLLTWTEDSDTCTRIMRSTRGGGEPPVLLCTEPRRNGVDPLEDGAGRLVWMTVGRLQSWIGGHMSSVEVDYCMDLVGHLLCVSPSGRVIFTSISGHYRIGYLSCDPSIINQV